MSDMKKCPNCGKMTVTKATYPAPGWRCIGYGAGCSFYSKEYPDTLNDAQQMVEKALKAAKLLREAYNISKRLEDIETPALGFRLPENLLDEEAYTIDTAGDLIDLVEAWADSLNNRFKAEKEDDE
jgi:hypothetical protein